jgi:hypothetical protein
MKKKNDRGRQSNAFRSLCVAVFAFSVYLTALWFLARPFIGWVALGKADEKGLLSAIKYDERNPTYHYFLGRLYRLDIDNPDLEKAIGHYRQSIRLSPLQPEVWVELSRAYQMSGETVKAKYALERAVMLNQNDPNLLWGAGMFWLLNDMTGNAVSALRKYILLAPERQLDVYDLCWKLGLDNTYITANLVPGRYAYQSSYLTYLMSTKRTVEAQDVWANIDKKGLEKGIFISYVNFLISNGLYDEAEKVWKEITPKISGFEKIDNTSPVWNPSFEYDILNGGFDWVIGEIEGASVFLDDTVRMTGNRSIAVTFDGTGNPDIAVAQQVVVVNPGTKYRLSGYIKTDSLSTTNGMFIEVAGYRCSGLDRRSEVITGTNFWKELTVDFEPPQECRAVTVKIRREMSYKLDNKIKGTAWIDGITLKQQTDSQITASKRP